MNINRKRRNCSITTSSMSDIGFLLLIFIMLISLMNQRHEQPIEYTEALNLEKTQAEKNFEIWVMADGGVYVDGIRQTGESLEQNIAAAVVANPGVRIHVIADRNTPYRYVDSVVQILQRLQHRVVSFVVQEVR
ncbi:MAG: biopolymer transporter ExbD [Spirochaetia bacterium]|uniref:ExbD/TolR family protein n=1 Tax=Treponema sp. TaxID=166 RepID=UPI00298DC4C1|nr:biopolymer transporter ExbD [Treponema sp.]MCI7398737.1 biopolymer transporter ExbD [Spirochaetia bacterium]MCI7577783.1 biopolymer transporter ExbD [Spirochaetia bacterium]